MGVLRRMYELGVRMMTLTWNHENELASPQRNPGGVLVPQTEKGLTGKGFEFLAEMERMHMIVDVSHLSDKGFWDIVEHGTRPFAASHSNCRALAPHTRNLTDEMIRALSERGGIAGLNYYAPFLDADPTHPENCRSTVELIAKHAAHYKQVGGAQMIALGSDFDGIDGPHQLENAAFLPLLADALRKEGFTEDEVEEASISAMPCAFLRITCNNNGEYADMDKNMTLEKRIAAELYCYQGKMSVFVDDLQGHTVEVGADEEFETASTIKAFILAALYLQAQRGKADLAEEITYEQSQFVDGSGMLRALGVGAKLKVKDTATMMIICSDNIATNMIIDYLGLDTINACIRELGFAHTVLHNPLHFDRYRRLGTTTPRDYAALFARIAKGSWSAGKPARRCLPSCASSTTTPC